MGLSERATLFLFSPLTKQKKRARPGTIADYVFSLAMRTKWLMKVYDAH